MIVGRLKDAEKRFTDVTSRTNAILKHIIDQRNNIERSQTTLSDEAKMGYRKGIDDVLEYLLPYVKCVIESYEQYHKLGKFAKKGN